MTTSPAGEAAAWGGRRLLLSVPALIVRPRRTFANLAQLGQPTWLVPLVVISLCALVSVAAVGSVRQAAGQAGAGELPPDFQYYSASQQAQFLQAQEATRSSTFLFLLPGAATLAQVWLGWLITGSVLHLASTILGGRSSSTSVLSLTAWSGLPLGIRFLIRAGFVALAGRGIAATGLAGFAGDGTGGAALFVRELLSLVDLYWAWHVALLAVGMGALGGLGKGRIALSLGLTEAVALLVQAIPAAILSSLAGLTIIRPFFF